MKVSGYEYVNGYCIRPEGRGWFSVWMPSSDKAHGALVDYAKGKSAAVALAESL